MSKIKSYKIYLNEGGKSSEEEIRKFAADANVVKSFEYFYEKLQIIFPKLKGKRFTVNWKDADGDMITISSTEELVFAVIERSQEPIHTFYLKIQNDDQPNAESCSSASPGTLHKGVLCDGCNGPIHGFRFHCIQCPDFDLCSSCQSRELHPEHYMLRLVDPLNAKAHLESRFMRYMHKFTEKHSQSSHDDDDDKEKEKKEKARVYKCGNKKWEKYDKSAPRCPIISDTGNIINSITEYLNELAQTSTETPTQTTTTENPVKQQTKDQDKNQTKEQPAPEAKYNKKKYSNMKEVPKFEIPLSNQHDLFKKLSSNLSYFLDPLGISADITIKTSDDQEPTSSNNNKEKNNSDSNANSKAESPTPSTSKSNSEATTSKNFDDKNDTDKENSVSSSSEKKINNEPVTSKINVECVLEKEGNSDSEWTIIQKVAPKTKEPPKSSAPLYPPLPEEKKIFHPDPNIQTSVEAMIQMGFSNEHDQLTNLLVVNNGDIISVIDILQQQQQF